MAVEITWKILLGVQTLHLLHHRLARRHISIAEVVSSALLCVPTSGPLPQGLLMAAHLLLSATQRVGSVWIRTLSPEWEAKREG